MLRRAIAAVVFAGAAVALPVAAASAVAPSYPASDYTLTCSTAQAVPGATFTCTIAGPDGSSTMLQTTFSGADATIAGSVTSSPKVVTGGVATYTVTAPSVEGTIDISGIIGSQTIPADVSVTVAAALASTGYENTGLAVGAGALLVVGASIVFISARLRSARHR